MGYNAAFRKHKPCFIYLKKVEKRGNKLTKFLDERVKPQFKMHDYDTKSDLYKMIRENLQDHLLELLQKGLKKYKEEQKLALKRDKATRKQSAKAITERKEVVPFQMLTDAEQATKTGDLVSAILKTSISFETWLRLNLIRKAGLPESELEKRPLGYLDLGTRKKLLSSHDVSVLREVQHMRNRTVHEGITPTKKDVEWAVKTVSAVIKSRNREES